MCYYCHTLKKNPFAPAHRSLHCQDSRNSYSAANLFGSPNKYCRQCRKRTHHYRLGSQLNCIHA